MKEKRNPMMKEHFEKLKELVPEIYSRQNDKSQEIERLYQLLKNSLGVIEAVYLQHQDKFHPATIEEYGKIVYELELMGYDYQGNDDLLGSAAAQILMGSKKPMKKAGKRSSSDGKRRAI